MSYNFSNISVMPYEEAQYLIAEDKVGFAQALIVYRLVGTISPYSGVQGFYRVDYFGFTKCPNTQKRFVIPPSLFIPFYGRRQFALAYGHASDLTKGMGCLGKMTIGLIVFIFKFS